MAGDKLAMVLAQRQKRLHYVSEQFKSAQIPPQRQNEVSNLLETYVLWISKLSKAATEPEQKEASDKLAALDRKLTVIFDELRLRTTTIGGMAVKNLDIIRPHGKGKAGANSGH